MPFNGACQGDRGFDVATLLFYGYDVPATRETLWERAIRISGIGWTTVYLCHLSAGRLKRPCVPPRSLPVISGWPARPTGAPTRGGLHDVAAYRQVVLSDPELWV